MRLPKRADFHGKGSFGFFRIGAWTIPGLRASKDDSQSHPINGNEIEVDKT